MRERTKPEQISLVVRIFICIFCVSIVLFVAIKKQNELIELRLKIPVIIRQVRDIQEENNLLIYEIERFESPIHLMELMRNPEFSHLKYPYLKDEVFLSKPSPLPEIHHGA